MYIIQRQFAEQSFRYCQMSAIYGLQYIVFQILLVLFSHLLTFIIKPKLLDEAFQLKTVHGIISYLKCLQLDMWLVTCEWWTPNWTQSCLCGHFNSSNLVICWLLTFCPVSVGWVMEEKQVSQSYQTFSAKLCQHQDHCDTVKSGRGKYTDSKTVRQFFYFLLSTVRQYIDIAAL